MERGRNEDKAQIKGQQEVKTQKEFKNLRKKKTNSLRMKIVIGNEEILR